MEREPPGHPCRSSPNGHPALAPRWSDKYVVVIERYAHLRPELFTPKDLATLLLDMQSGGVVVPARACVGTSSCAAGSGVRGWTRVRLAL